MPKSPQLTGRELAFVSAEAGVDQRTTKRAYAGETLKNNTYERIVAAAKKLGVVLPPEAKTR